MSETTFDIIARIAKSHNPTVSAHITPATRINQLGFDEVDMGCFLFDLEMATDADIDFDRDPIFKKVQTLQELADAIDRQRSARSA